MRVQGVRRPPDSACSTVRGEYSSESNSLITLLGVAMCFSGRVSLVGAKFLCPTLRVRAFFDLLFLVANRSGV
jgi:hypothetical protein